MKTAALSLAGLVLGLGSCQGPPPQLAAVDAQSAWQDDDSRTAFDPLDAEAVRGVGDRVSYRIESNATGEIHTWDLELRTGALPEAEDSYWYGDPHCGYVRARANRVQITNLEAPEKHLVEYRGSAAPLHVRLTRDGQETFETSVESSAILHVRTDHVDAIPNYGLGELVRVLLNVDHLQEELISVVQPPSLWSVVARGMRVDIRLDFPGVSAAGEGFGPVETVESPFGAVLAYWLPFQLLANDQPALECRALITWRRSPLLHTVGVLRLEAWHPEDQDRRVHAVLTGAKRGEGALPDRDDLGMGLRRGMTESEVERRTGRSIGTRETRTGLKGQELAIVELQSATPDHPLWAVFDPEGLQFSGFREVIDEYLDRSRQITDRPAADDRADSAPSGSGGARSSRSPR